MKNKYIILLYLTIIIGVTGVLSTVSFSYSLPTEIISQYIVDLSKEIQSSIHKPDIEILGDSKGELKLKLLISPWGELKDAYVFESSGNAQLDSVCISAVWKLGRYQPFPQELGDKDLWIDVPIIFETSGIKKYDVDVKDEWFKVDSKKHYQEPLGL